MRVGVIGTTSWGTALGLILARREVDVVLWARTHEEAETLNRAGKNARFLPDCPFPSSLTVSSSPDEALGAAEVVIFAVPSHSLRENTRLIRSAIPSTAVIVSGVKGLEVGTGLRMTQVLEEELGVEARDRLCALSGPNLAREIAIGMPASTVVAARSQETAIRVQDLFNNPLFRVYTNADVVGVELGGSLKNIVALVAGMADGLHCGDNGKAAIISRAVAEMIRLGVALGANPLTFSGLAGLGDLIATCYSPLSRNHYVGQELGNGRKLDDILSHMDNVAEGVDTTKAALVLAAKVGVEMPIAQQTARVLWGGLSPMQAVEELMSRLPKAENPFDPWRGIHAG